MNALKYQIINSRLIPILAVTDDRMKKEAELMFENIKAGKPFVISTDVLEDIKSIDIIDNANIEKMQYLTSFNESLNKRLFNEFGIDVENVKDKRAQVNSLELNAFEDVNALNYLSYYEERLDFCKRMKDIFGIEIRVIPCPIYADEPNEDEIENPEPAPEENGKDGENDVSENN